MLAEIFCIFECLSRQNLSNQALSYLPEKRLLQNQKTGGSWELFLAENYFQTSSTVIFSKKYLDFGGLETNQRHEIQTFFSVFFTDFFSVSHKLLHMNSM